MLDFVSLKQVLWLTSALHVLLHGTVMVMLTKGCIVKDVSMNLQMSTLERCRKINCLNEVKLTFGLRAWTADWNSHFFFGNRIAVNFTFIVYIFQKNSNIKGTVHRVVPPDVEHQHLRPKHTGMWATPPHALHFHLLPERLCTGEPTKIILPQPLAHTSTVK